MSFFNHVIGYPGDICYGNRKSISIEIYFCNPAMSYVSFDLRSDSFFVFYSKNNTRNKFNINFIWESRYFPILNKMLLSFVV